VPGAALGTPYLWKWALGSPTSGYVYACVCGEDFRALARAARVEPVCVNRVPSTFTALFCVPYPRLAGLWSGAGSGCAVGDGSPHLNLEGVARSNPVFSVFATRFVVVSCPWCLVVLRPKSFSLESFEWMDKEWMFAFARWELFRGIEYSQSSPLFVSLAPYLFPHRSFAGSGLWLRHVGSAHPI
jgi:hypothetical protein